MGADRRPRSEEVVLAQILRCEACGASVTSLRRGRCSICYLRWTEERPVGRGATCVICAERRRDYLKNVEFQRRWLTMCHSCSARAFKLSPLPATLETLRSVLARDRRSADRRQGQGDARLFRRERRVGERRAPPVGTVDEWIDAEELIIEIIDDGGGSGEATKIVSQPVESLL